MPIQRLISENQLALFDRRFASIADAASVLPRPGPYYYWHQPRVIQASVLDLNAPPVDHSIEVSEFRAEIRRAYETYPPNGDLVRRRYGQEFYVWCPVNREVITSLLDILAAEYRCFVAFNEPFDLRHYDNGRYDADRLRNYPRLEQKVSDHLKLNYAYFCHWERQTVGSPYMVSTPFHSPDWVNELYARTTLTDRLFQWSDRPDLDRIRHGSYKIPPPPAEVVAWCDHYRYTQPHLRSGLSGIPVWFATPPEGGQPLQIQDLLKQELVAKEWCDDNGYIDLTLQLLDRRPTWYAHPPVNGFMPVPINDLMKQS